MLKRSEPLTSGPPAFFSSDVAAARRFYLDLNPPKRLSLAVVCGGVEHCSAQYAIRRDNFPFFSIEYVARGGGKLKLNGSTQILPAKARLASCAPADCPPAL